jgi:hypothetical protein
MDNYPVHLFLFGLFDSAIEPFCYGCAGFILSYRVSRTLISKVAMIGLTVFAFVLMDDIWPAVASRSAQMGTASANNAVTKMLGENRSLGKAEYHTGASSGLWDIYNLGARDIGSAVLFVPLAFLIGLRLTDRAWKESERIHPSPPGPPRSSVPPAPPAFEP